MTTGREAFLQRVRQAVAAGNRAGAAADLPARGAIGYQGAGPDLAASFAKAFAAVGGRLHRAADRAAAREHLLRLVQAHAARRVLVGDGAVLAQLDVRSALAAAGAEVMAVAEQAAGGGREVFFAADLGVSGVDYLLAETGSIVLGTRPDQPRSLSLLPPVHVAIAQREQILPDLFDLFQALGAKEGEGLPSSVSIITGPSKTGDIEMRLVTGVHGPGEVHVILIENSPQGTGTEEDSPQRTQKQEDSPRRT